MWLGGGLNRNCQGFLRSLCVHIDSWCMCLYCLPPPHNLSIYPSQFAIKKLYELSLYTVRTKQMYCTLYTVTKIAVNKKMFYSEREHCPVKKRLATLPVPSRYFGFVSDIPAGNGECR